MHIILENSKIRIIFVSAKNMLLKHYLLLSEIFNTASYALFGKDVILAFYYLVFIFCLVCVILLLSYFLSPQFRFSTEKQSSYECGFEPFGDARMAFDIHFYIIGILFLLFDLEIVFIFPWLFSFTEYSDLMSTNVNTMVLFLGLLGFGFVYEWVNNALIWVPVRFED